MITSTPEPPTISTSCRGMIISSFFHQRNYVLSNNLIFFLQTRSEISMLYNDRSVLENFHISEAFKVMRKEESNIVANLSREEYRLVFF